MPSYSATYKIPNNINNIIDGHALGMGGVGIVGGILGPGTDLPAIAASWVAMTMQIAGEAGHDVDEKMVAKLTAAVATGAGSFYLGSKVAATAGGWIGAAFTGGVSLIFMVAGNVALNAAFTESYGKACARYFLQANEVDPADIVAKVIIEMMLHSIGVTTADIVVTETIHALQRG